MIRILYSALQIYLIVVPAAAVLFLGWKCFSWMISRLAFLGYMELAAPIPFLTLGTEQLAFTHTRRCLFLSATVLAPHVNQCKIKLCWEGKGSSCCSLKCSYWVCEGPGAGESRRDDLFLCGRVEQNILEKALFPAAPSVRVNVLKLSL